MTTKELLIAARARLTATGWTQGSLGTPSSPNCLVGAVVHAWGDVPWDGAVEGAAYEALRAATRETFVTDWNDRAGRTLEEVLAVLDLAIGAES